MTDENRIQLLVDKCFDLEAALGRFKGELKACANELCLRCGEYKHEHLGSSCVDCRFRKVRHGDWSDIDWSPEELPEVEDGTAT